LWSHTLTTTQKGYFIIDDKITVEVGGKNKSFKQIKDIKTPFKDTLLRNRYSLVLS
jgi:uncharacterized protein YutD